MRGDAWLLLAVASAMAFGAVSAAAAPCSLVREVPELLGQGSAVRLAVDPTSLQPVAMWRNAGGGVTYRRYLGPAWGVPITVDTGGLALAEGEGGVLLDVLDLVVDDLGRPRTFALTATGLFQIELADGWQPPEPLMDLSLGTVGLGALQVRAERDDAGRVHVLVWTDAWSGGGAARRSYHLFDVGGGFGTAELFDNGAWVPHGAADASGNFHVVGIDAFPPSEPNTPHQFQAVYWRWTVADGWPGAPVQLTHEPNPPTGNGAGPVGFAPEVAIGPDDQPQVVYPMHATEDATDGQVHLTTLGPGGWAAPLELMATNGHGGQPLVAVDRRGARLVVSLVYDKYFSFDAGSGFSAPSKWDPSGAHWQFHDLVQVAGQFWHAYVPVDWKTKAPGEVRVVRFGKQGDCPGSSGTDADDDGAPDDADVCPGLADPLQADTDGDGVGDGCDGDDDGDGVDDALDVCPRIFDPAQADGDGDGLGDACSGQLDADGDGALATVDCDDGDPAVHPGAAELCNGRDDDCDGQIDGAECSAGGGGGALGAGGDTAAPLAASSDRRGLVGGCTCRLARHGSPLSDSGLAVLWLVLLAWRRQRGWTRSGRSPRSAL